MDKTLIEKILYGGGVFFDLTKWILLTIIVLVLVGSFWYTVFLVDGISMEPNFLDGELVVLDKTFFRGDKIPQRGQPVVVRYPGDPDNKRYVKRVVGLPYEDVLIASGGVYIDGKLLDERYLPVYFETEPDGSWGLKDNEYFLMGDNRANSNDSRYFGVVEKRFFIGRAVAIIFPRLRFVELPLYK